MSISLQEILTQALGFIILVFVLRKLAWKPLLTLLDDRRNKIKSGFEDIDHAKRNVEQLRLDYEHARNNIEQEARAKLQESIDEGKKVVREIQESARHEARAILDKAKSDIAIETAKAKVALRDDLADLTFAVTEKLIREKLNETKDKELVLDFIDEIEKLKHE